MPRLERVRVPVPLAKTCARTLAENSSSPFPQEPMHASRIGQPKKWAYVASFERDRSRMHWVLGRSFHYERGFGGGFGLGTPVVSYAPLPMFMISSPLSIIWGSIERA